MAARTLIVFLLLFSSISGPAAPVVTDPFEYALTLEPFTFFDPAAGADERIGLGGVKLLVAPNRASGLRYGFGALVSVAGRRGGLIFVGVEAAYDIALWGPLKLRPELFAGGGGGSQVFVGSGLIVRPSVALLASFEKFSVGAGYSMLALPAVATYHHQPFGQVSVASDFTFLGDFFGPEKPARALRPADWTFRPTVKLFRTGGARNVLGQRLSPTIGLVGMQIDHHFHGPLFTSVDLAGAFSGSAGGFSAFSLGVGYAFERKPFRLIPRVQLGAAGGGQIHTGGGLFVEPSLQLEWGVIDGIALHGGAGYIASFGGELRFVTFSSGVAFRLRGIEAENLVDKREVGDAAVERTSRWRLVTGLSRYLTNGKTAMRANFLLDDIDLLALRFDYRPWENFFLSAQSYWPVGGNAGGFAAGLVGAGYDQPIWGPVSIEARLAAGAAAGGGLPAGGGAALQGNVAGVLRVARDLSITAGGGLLAFRSGFRTVMIDAGLRYDFGVPVGL